MVVFSCVCGVRESVAMGEEGEGAGFRGGLCVYCEVKMGNGEWVVVSRVCVGVVLLFLLLVFL